MNLLVTNDDGVNAKGIYALAKELEKYHHVTIVAPDDQRSATSHAITIIGALKVEEVKLEGLNSKVYSVNGTPADCVRIGIDQLIDGKVDMVVSGINRGFNLGVDVIYSGTVSAAIEAAIYKIPSVAISTDITDSLDDYLTAATYAVEVVGKALSNNMDNDLVLNVNVPIIPKQEIKGIKVCKIGNTVYNNYFEEIQSEQEGRLFDVKGKLNKARVDETDTKYIDEGYVTLTPLHYDLTNFKILREVDQWW